MNRPRENDLSSVDGHEADRRIQRVALYALLVNVALAVLRGWLAHLSGSLAVIAVTIDAGVDVAAALLLWGGLKLSVRKTRTFPYGLYKVENVTQVVVAVLIFVVGAEILREAITGSNSVIASPIVIGGMAFSTVAVLGLSLYMRREGKKSASPGLLAEARHRWVDLVASAVVFLALVSARFGLPVDRPASGLVAAFIIYSGWGLLWDGMKVLLDASLDQETLVRIRSIVESDPAVIGVRSLNGRNSGRYRFIELIVVVRAENLEKAHAISTRVERRIRAEVARIDRVIIHTEPQVPTDVRVAVPLDDLHGTVASHFGEARFFAWLVVHLDGGEVEEQRIEANPVGKTEKARGILVAEWLIRQKVDVVIQKEALGKGPEYAFKDAGVQVEVWNVTPLSEVIARLRMETPRFRP